METASSAQLPAYERLILLIEQYPCSAFYRIGLGCVLPLLYCRISSKEDSEWFLILWFLSCLFAIRLFPAVFRKVFPFSKEVKGIWAERREIAKRYDSYQWRKLIWFGIGMACYVVLSGTWNAVVVALTAFCVVGGGIGVFVWRKRSAAEKVAIA